jgi:hypothetical protein
LGQSGTHPGWPFFFSRFAAGNQASGVVASASSINSVPYSEPNAWGQ